jgi:FkbM family methyltransferase
MLTAHFSPSSDRPKRNPVMLRASVQHVARQFGYEFSRVSDQIPSIELQDYPCIDLLDMVMQHYVKIQPDVFFVQIGAHDGVSADPTSRQIRKYSNWHGILVEPQPDYFQQLVMSYENETRFRFEPAAIGSQDGTMPFYTVTDEIANLTFWLPQSASFDREHVLGSLHYWKYAKKVAEIPEDLDSVIKVLQVPTLTIKSLLKKYHVEKVDLLALGTPALDFDIIQQFPFEQMKPAVICFEYLTLPMEKRRACLQFLAEKGYGVSRFASRAVASLNAPKIQWTIGEY